jgi:hypothetical protein
MDLAMTFNEVGCQLYRSGQGEEAYELFSGAMQALHYSCGGIRDDLDPVSQQLLLLDPSIQRAFDRATTSRDDTVVNSFAAQEKEKQGNGRQRSPSLDITFIFNEVVSMDGLKDLPSANLHYAIAISIILYNEALVLHRGQVKNLSRSLERAVTFYGMASTSLLDNCPWEFIQRHQLTSTLCCGILNNMGFLLHQIGDFYASRKCFARLCEVLEALPPPASEGEQRQRQEFELNFLLLSRSLSTAAAA